MPKRREMLIEQMPSQTPRLIPLQQAAADYKVSQVTLYRYLKVGRLRRYKRAMDSKTYLDCDELEQLLQARPVDAHGRA